MQIVYISNRPEVLRGTLTYVAAFMPFIDSCVVFCPAALTERFRETSPSLLAIAEDELLGPQAREFGAAADHQRRNYLLRSALAAHSDVADEFIMSDDDYRPLTHLDASYYRSDGKHQPFYFYSAERWAEVVNRKRLTSFDVGMLSVGEVLRECDLTTLLFSSHMPQIVHRGILLESKEFFAPFLEKYASLPEWETYFAFGLDRFPDRFHAPAPFTVLGWPDRPHWPWYVKPARFDFENFYESAYRDGGLFAGLPAEYDPETHQAVTEEKIRRHAEFFAADQARRDRKRERARRRRRFVHLRPREWLSDNFGAWARNAVHRRPAPLAEPYTVAGLFQYRTGLGNAASVLSRTLRAAAPLAKVDGLDVSGFFAPRDASPRSAGVRLAAGEGTIVLCVNPPQGAQYLTTMPRRLRRGKRIIGYWWWEFPSFPDSWRPYIGYFDEVWVSSRFIHRAWDGLLGIPVRLVPLDLREPDVAPDGGAGSTRQNRDRLKLLAILNLGSTISRKNPGAAIAVFRQLKRSLGDGVSLTVKLGAVTSYPERYLELLGLGTNEPGIDVLVSPLSDQGLNRLIDDHDVYLSMHRAEGLGLLMAKAMARQKAVAATRWSGNLDFMTDESSILIDFAPTTIFDENRNASGALACAEPDCADAANKILQAAGSRNRLDELGRRGRDRIEAVSRSAIAYNRERIFGLPM